MTSPSILTICGSLRAGSYHHRLLLAAETELARLGITVTRYDRLRDVPHYDEDLDADGARPDLVNELRSLVATHDGMLIASPTYNFTAPGALKDFVDWASRPFRASCLVDRHFALITASTGPSAGVAGGEYLQTILTMLGAHHVSPTTSIAKVSHSFDDHNAIVAETLNRVKETTRALALAVRGAKFVNNVDAARYELRINDGVAGFCDYRPAGGDSIELPHTVTEPAFSGQGVASTLVRHVLDDLRSNGRTVVPSCSFVRTFISTNPTYEDLVAG